MTDGEWLTGIEELLLMAAVVHGFGPDTRLTHANSAKVVGQALRWAGVVDKAAWAAWANLDTHPAIDRVCDALARMTCPVNRGGPIRPPDRPGDPLFEGAGDWGDRDRSASHPQFTACRLTARGQAIARQLLERHPAYQPAAQSVVRRRGRMRRHAIIAGVVIVALLSAVGVGVWADWKLGPRREELVPRLTADLGAVTTPEEAEAAIPRCGTVRFPSGEWVTGVGVDSHSWKRAKGTLVVRDSRGRVRAFVGHVCGPNWMPRYFPPNHRDFPDLDAFYAFLTERGMTEYTPPGP